MLLFFIVIPRPWKVLRIDSSNWRNKLQVFFPISFLLKVAVWPVFLFSSRCFSSFSFFFFRWECSFLMVISCPVNQSCHTQNLVLHISWSYYEQWTEWSRSLIKSFHTCSVIFERALVRLIQTQDCLRRELPRHLEILNNPFDWTFLSDWYL